MSSAIPITTSNADPIYIIGRPERPPLEALPQPTMRPYPTKYITPWTMKDGMTVTIRPIRPDDELLMTAFHKTLSERSVELRYFHLIKLSHRVAHNRLMRICFNDYDRETALVAERRDPVSGKAEILGISRLSKSCEGHEAEIAVLISDKWQHQGLGTKLVRLAMDVARDEGVRRLSATVMGHNTEMQTIFEQLGFKLCRALDDGMVTAVAEIL
jgi:acetyltransferase